MRLYATLKLQDLTKDTNMSQRNYASGGKIYSMHVKPVFLTATITIGATGAVSSFVGSAIQSVTRTSTGLYRINFQPNTNFARLYSCIGSVQSPSSGLSGIGAIETQNAPNAAVSNLANPGISIKTVGTGGSLADPASGSSVSVFIILSDSSVLIGGE